MRVAISGAANVGKSTLIQSFKRRWPMYTSPIKTYRDVIMESGLPHSSKTSEDSQAVILKWMMEEELNTTKDSKVIFDRCSYDNLAYTLQGNENNLISDAYTALTISLVKESLKNLDIIFWIKRDKNIPIVADGLRDINPDFLEQSDKIFQDLFHQYCENLESDVFFHKENCPFICQLEGNTIDDRLAFIGEFIDYKGDLIEIFKDFNKLTDNTSLLERESHYIRLFDSTNPEKGYNFCNYSTDRTGVPHTPEAKEKMRQKALVRTYTEEGKNRLRTINIGRKLSEEHKEKIRQGNLGKFVTEETRKKLSEAGKGKSRSKEAVEKTRKANLGRVCSEETRAKMRKSSRYNKERENI